MTDDSYTKTATLNALALGAFAVCAALTLAITYAVTKAPIAESRRIAEQSALLEVLGNTAFDNDLINDLIPLDSKQRALLNLPEQAQARVVRHQGNIGGFIFPVVAADGYSGDISMLIGLDSAGEILGVRVVEHRETPGLGDKIDTKKSDWILGFRGKSLTNPSIDNWAVQKDGGEFDAFTGATITPRAIINSIRTTLELYTTDAKLLQARANTESEVIANGQ